MMRPYLLVLLLLTAPAVWGQPLKIAPAGTLENPASNETSGIAASRIHSNTLYIHNDSGDTSRFFAVSTTGKQLATFYFKGNSYYSYSNGVKDCEDIAVGPGPDKAKTYIYLADIGDNLKVRSYISIYRFEEPAKVENATLSRQVIHLKYPDGAKDAETVMIDPVFRAIYIVTKRDETVSIYSTPLDFNDGDTLKLSKKGTLFVEGERPGKWIVSGDISADGSKILIKSLQKIYYWKRKPGATLEETVKAPPVELPYQPEPQGEAVGFNPEATGYYTVSEGKNAGIYFYKLPE